MPRIVKNTLLNYIPTNIPIENLINSARIFELNKNDIKDGPIIYFCEREIRAKDNFALQFAINKSKEIGKQLKIIHPENNYIYKPKQNFIERQISQAKEAFLSAGLDFETIKSNDILPFLQNSAPSILIIDFNPILDRKWLNKITCKIYEIDGHNIVPARFVSDRMEYNAATLRRKIYYSIYPFLTEFENTTNYKTEADLCLKLFLREKLQNYTEYKNNPNENATSNLSKYLNLGFISSQRVALEVINAKVSDENKEAFLEELVIRKELSDNFCLYCKNFKTLRCTPNWAKQTLKLHQNDSRDYIYDKKELENAKTHDPLWNSAQIQLKKEGKIHGYLRMYWAKKILEWSPNAEKALHIAIYLNDKYAYDAPSANGYVGILWSIAGLHDRAFKESAIFGKVRNMSYDSLKKKFEITKFIMKYPTKI